SREDRMIKGYTQSVAKLPTPDRIEVHRTVALDTFRGAQLSSKGERHTNLEKEIVELFVREVDSLPDEKRSAYYNLLNPVGSLLREKSEEKLRELASRNPHRPRQTRQEASSAKPHQ